MASAIRTAAEKGKTRNSLVCMLQAMEGVVTVLELKGGTAVEGRVLSVDAVMNVELTDVRRFQNGSVEQLSTLFVAAGAICYAHIPEGKDPEDLMREGLARVSAPVLNPDRRTRLAKTTRQRRDETFMRHKEKMLQAMQKQKKPS